MKKIFILAAVCAAFGLVGCSAMSNSGDVPIEVRKDVKTAPSAEQTAPKSTAQGLQQNVGSNPNIPETAKKGMGIPTGK